MNKLEEVKQLLIQKLEKVKEETNNPNAVIRIATYDGGYDNGVLSIDESIETSFFYNWLKDVTGLWNFGFDAQAVGNIYFDGEFLLMKGTHTYDSIYEEVDTKIPFELPKESI